MFKKFTSLIQIKNAFSFYVDKNKINSKKEIQKRFKPLILLSFAYFYYKYLILEWLSPAFS